MCIGSKYRDDYYHAHPRWDFRIIAARRCRRNPCRYLGIISKGPSNVNVLRYHFPRPHSRYTIPCTKPLITGPFIAGYLSMTGPEGWRWLFWTLCVFGGTSTIVLFFTLPETYAPIVLRTKAQRIRAETGDAYVYAANELEDQRILKILKITLSRPFQMIFGDIIIFLVCLYLSFVYGVQYFFFQAYPIIFQDIHGLNPGEGGLAFVAVAIGSIIGCLGSQYWDYRRQRPTNMSVEEGGSDLPLPTSEQLRLPITIIAGPFFVIAYFWLGWTSYQSIPVIVPMLSGLFFGAGSLFLFSGFFNYLTDCYYYAASALAASTITRSCFGAGFPMFTHVVSHPHLRSEIDLVDV